MSWNSQSVLKPSSLYRRGSLDLNRPVCEAQANHVANTPSSDFRGSSVVGFAIPHTLILVLDSQPDEDPNHGHLVHPALEPLELEKTGLHAFRRGCNCRWELAGINPAVIRQQMATLLQRFRLGTRKRFHSSNPHGIFQDVWVQNRVIGKNGK